MLRFFVTFIVLGFAGFICSNAIAAEVTESPEALIRLLGDKDYKVREDATDKLVLLGGKALKALSVAAKSRDPEVSMRAKAIIDQFGTVKVSVVRKVRSILLALGTRTRYGRIDQQRLTKAYREMRGLGRGVPRVVVTLLPDFVRTRTTFDFMNTYLCAEGGKSIVKDLVRSMSTRALSGWLGRSIFDTALQIDRKETMKSLKNLLKQGTDDEKANLLSQLYNMFREDILPAIAPLLEDSNYKVRREAFRILTRAASPGVYMKQVLAGLTDKDATVRRHSLSILRRTKDDSAIPHLVKLIDNSKLDFRDRWTAMTVLMEFGGTELRKVVTRILSSEDASYKSLRCNVIGHVARFNEKWARDLVRKFIKSNDAGLRRSAVQSAGLMRDSEATPLIADLLRTEKDYSVLSAAIEAMAVLTKDKAAAVQLFKPYLNSKNMGLAESAVRALGALRSKEAITPLIDALDGRFRAAYYANQELIVISGRRYGEIRPNNKSVNSRIQDKWRKWWKKNKVKFVFPY